MSGQCSWALLGFGGGELGEWGRGVGEPHGSVPGSPPTALKENPALCPGVEK